MTERPNPPTLRRISELSGLAIPTVSRALHAAPDIDAETRSLVQGIAREIGYASPGRRPQSDRASKVIAFALASSNDSLSSSPRLIEAIAAALHDTPFRFVVAPYFDQGDPLVPIRNLLDADSVDAIIMNKTEYEDPRIRYLMDRGVPFVTHGRSKWANRHAYYDFDNDAFAQLCLNWLADRGRRRVLLIAPPVRQYYARHMINGATQAARNRHVELEVLDSATSEDDNRTMQQAVATLLPNGIDGVICGSPNAAVGALAALNAEGRRVGQDIDICAKEAMPLLRVCSDLFVVEEDVTRAGAALARAAVQSVTQPDLPLIQTLEVPRTFRYNPSPHELDRPA